MAQLILEYSKRKAVCNYYFLNGSALTQFPGVKYPDKVDASGILKVTNEVFLIFKSSDTLNNEE